VYDFPVYLYNRSSQKTKKMTITIPDKALIDAEISPNELLVDFATYLYDKQILSIGQARKIIPMDLISFQMELSKRNIYIHYDIDDLAKDLANLKAL
jgi:predicted HTH domain antitoxin